MIENAIVKKDEFKYEIYPKEGYKLHEKSRDEVVTDAYGNETGEIKLGYTFGVVTALADYDFETNPREIYAVAADDVSEGGNYE